MTAPLITLRQAKVQCRIEVSDDEKDISGGRHPDNTYLSGLISGAILAFENTTSRKLYAGDELPVDAPEQALLCNELIQLGLLMLISHWYENREPVGNVGAEIPFSFTYITDPYRWFHL